MGSTDYQEIRARYGLFDSVDFSGGNRRGTYGRIKMANEAQSF